jgi:exo-1,4-beta-D-glucosaminidase
MKSFFINTLIIGIFMMNAVSCNQKSGIENQSVDFAKDWELFSSEDAPMDGNRISTTSFKVEKSYNTEIPATVMAALIRNHVYEDVFYSDNLKKIPGGPFTVPWWYRKTFKISSSADPDYYRLVFEGLNQKANIWLNGTQIGAADTIAGCFRMFAFNITELLQTGENVLAVEIIPPERGDLTIGFVDWNPWPPDNNMGLWRPVKLCKSGEVALKNVFVKPTLNTETLNEANLTICTDLVNYSGKAVSGRVEAGIDGFIIKQEYSLDPYETRKIQFGPSGYTELNLKNPRIWWPNNLGNPNLYTLGISAVAGNRVSDSNSVRFGIREVEDYYNENGHRGYRINGKEILIKGAGWTDDMFLADSDEKILDQIRYVRHMNLNTIRLEGFWGNNKKIYEYADENGILIMIGWSCQWEWEGYSGRPEDKYMAIRSAQEIGEHTRAYQNQVEWLRNHPGVFLWVYASDKLLVPDLEKRLDKMLSEEDGTRPILNSCGSVESEITGRSGVKMNGPYGYVTPNYWYVDDKKGGAFGFNTETGPGVQPAPFESIKKMIPRENLWPVDSIWEFHLGRGSSFGTFKHWMKPFIERYGSVNQVETFTFKAQMANYEAMRPMFEAFHVNRPNSTGIIQWMLNSAWPGMLWQLYDWYLMPNGAFYATKNACRPLNIIYNYKDHDIYLSNDYHRPFEDLSAEIRVFHSSGKELFSETLRVRVDENRPVRIFEMPEIENPGTTYFLDLRLKDGEGELKAINFYWLSTREDVLDYENPEWFLTGNSSYADLTGINTLDEIEIDVAHDFVSRGDTLFINASLENSSGQIAFFIELSLKGKESGTSILPVFWDDNYISLLPGEKRQVSGYVFTKDLGTDEPLFSYRGWNIKSD